VSRNSYTATTSASYAGVTKFRLLMDIDSYTAGPVHACTGGNFVIVGATTYSPVGNLGGLDPIQEESDVFPRTLRAWLAAVNTAAIQDVINETAYNKPVRLYRAFLTDSLTVVNTPELLFKGRINGISMKLADPERGNYYEIDIESRLAQKSRATYMDQATHWYIYGQSGDLFFEHLSKIPLYKSQWGQHSTVYNFSPPPPSNLPPGLPGRLGLPFRP
jgi:hypothetical protein